MSCYTESNRYVKNRKMASGPRQIFCLLRKSIVYWNKAGLWRSRSVLRFGAVNFHGHQNSIVLGSIFCIGKCEYELFRAAL